MLGIHTYLSVFVRGGSSVMGEECGGREGLDGGVRGGTRALSDREGSR